MSMSYSAETCPICRRTDIEHSQVSIVYQCKHPWHSRVSIDKAAIAAREAKARTATTERAMRDDRPTTIRMRAETSRRCFEDMLTFFVQKYAPEHPYDRDSFQRDLMMLFRDAMQHQSGVFSMHMERTESTLYGLVNVSTGSLNAIFKEKE
jgi:hypothetical protein